MTDTTALALFTSHQNTYYLVWGTPLVDKSEAECLLFEFEGFRLADRDVLLGYLKSRGCETTIHMRPNSNLVQWTMVLSEYELLGLIDKISELTRESYNGPRKAESVAPCPSCVQFVTFKYCAQCGNGISGIEFDQASIRAAIGKHISATFKATHPDGNNAYIYKKLICNKNGNDMFSRGSPLQAAKLELSKPNLYKLVKLISGHKRNIDEDFLGLAEDSMLRELEQRLDGPIFIFGAFCSLILTADELEKYIPDLARLKAARGDWFHQRMAIGPYTKICCLMRTLWLLEEYLE